MCTTDEVLHLDQPHYDQDSYWGRVQTYFELYNPLNIFRTSYQIAEARCLYLKYRCGEPIPDNLDEQELWKAKAIYESTYNPETGGKIPFLARPSTQVPVNALLAGGMMAYYSSTVGVIVWQTLNQAYNAFVTSKQNAGNDTITDQQLKVAYAAATGTAVGTALGLNHLFRGSSPLVRRSVSLLAVAAAHCVSVPLLRAQLLKNGTPIYDDCNVKIGYSKMAAQAGISGAISNKIAYAIPPTILTPLFIHYYLDGRGTLCRYPWSNFPIHAAMALLFLTFISPLVSACYERKGLIMSKHLEPELQSFLCKKFYERPPKYVHFDKYMY